MRQSGSTCLLEKVFTDQRESSFIPQTVLGKKLYALRMSAITEGMNLLSEEEILEEIQHRRGEVGEDEANLC